MGGHELTPLQAHEIAFRIKQLEDTSDEHSNAIKLFAARLATGDEILSRVSSDIASVKGHIEWATKIIMGAVLLAVMALILAKATGPAPTAPSGHETGPSSSPSHAP